MGNQSTLRPTGPQIPRSREEILKTGPRLIRPAQPHVFSPADPGHTKSAWEVFSVTDGPQRTAQASAWDAQNKMEKSISREAAAQLTEDQSPSDSPKMPDVRCSVSNTATEIIETLWADGNVIEEKRYSAGHKFPPGYNRAKEWRLQWLADHAQPPSTTAPAATDVSPAAPSPAAPSTTASSSAAPKSRYFGQEKEEKTKEEIAKDEPEIDFEAPPPPEDHDHPAFVGNAATPVVCIPRKPVVNLPRGGAPIATAPPAPTPILDRIGNLLKEDRLKSVKSASKDALEEAPAAAVISLPGKLAATFQQVEQVIEWTATKPTDEDLFEPPAFASKPVVSISKVSHHNHQFGYQHELDFIMPWETEVLDVSTADREDELFVRDLQQKDRVWIRIPGTNKGTFAMQPALGSPPRNNSRRTVPAKSNSYAAKNNSSTGARKSPPHFGGQQSAPKPRNPGTWTNNTARTGATSWASSKRPFAGAQ